MGKIVSIATLVLLASSALAAAGPGGAPPPPEVEIITVESSSVPIQFDYVGVTQASKVVEIRARVQGFLETREFTEGSQVEAGTVLFTIDRRPFEADVQVAEAQVAQAETRVRLAEQEVERLRSVTVPGAIAQSDLDKQIAERENATAAVRLAKAQLDKAQLELSYTTVKAPITGYIGKTHKEIGSLVDAGQNSLLATVSQVDPMYVSFSVSERDLLTMRNAIDRGTLILASGEAPYIEVQLLDGSMYAHRGSIDFEDVAVSLGTGSVEMRATITNPDFALKPGQFVTVRIRGWVRPNTVAVPLRAVNQSPRGAYVYVVDDDNKAQMRLVEPGDWSGEQWIVNAGVSPGDRVVVEGHVKIQPGIDVVPVPYTPQSLADAAPASAATPPDVASAATDREAGGGA